MNLNTQNQNSLFMKIKIATNEHILSCTIQGIPNIFRYFFFLY